MLATDVLLILLCLTGISAGQILFKLAAVSVPSDFDPSGWLHFALNRFFLSALVVYGVATLLWVMALKRVDLTVAYPFMGLAFVIVPLASHFVLNERVTANTFVGAALIFVGLLVSSR